MTTTHQPRTYGYARVSARDQNLARQLDALRAFPVDEAHIFCDMASGATFDRPAWRALSEKLREGDTLVVMSVDRLGRNYDEVVNEWDSLTKSRHCFVVVLDMPLLDTRTAKSSVTDAFLADIALQLLSYVAQVERENTLCRQAEGIASAKARGVRFGRPKIARPPIYDEVKHAYQAGDITRREAAARLGIGTTTFDTWLREDKTAR
jgi:DNA invertase Pin-like site-specific DNA recombinase